MKPAPTYKREGRELAVQLRALADAVTRADLPASMVLEASATVARDLQNFAFRYVSTTNNHRR
jgi:hypothetical protein